MSNSARFIPSEEIDAQKVQQWRFGAVDGVHVAGALPATPSVGGFRALGSDFRSMPTAKIQAPAPVIEAEPAAVQDIPAAPAFDEAQLQALLEQARQEGVTEGLRQGHADGQAQADAVWQQRWNEHEAGAGRDVAQRLEAVVRSADAGLQALQQGMAQELLQLACDIARQVVRQELSCKPEALLPVVREALDMLVAEGRPATVRLHPEDWKQLETALRSEFASPKIEWLADASVPAGGCRVESGGTDIDGSVEKRWHRAVAALGLVSTWYEGNHGA